MICNCPSEDYSQVEIEGIVYCVKNIEIPNIECPEGCTLVIDEDDNAHCDCEEQIDPIITNVLVPISPSGAGFKDVSWTISFSPVMGSWLSFYSFKPNYYISHNNYFQTGINSQGSEFGLWSHLLTNKSYQVFYGKKYPFEIEYPVKSDYVNKTLQSVALNTEVKRYHNEYDYAPNISMTFDKSIIYNNLACSGELNLKPEKSRISNSKNYPKTNTDGTQDIMILNTDNDKWEYNYFYNRVKDNKNNIPFVLKDDNQIDLYLNSQAISFKGKSLLERMHGDYFLNRLTYNKDSRFKMLFKFATNTTEI